MRIKGLLTLLCCLCLHTFLYADNRSIEEIKSLVADFINKRTPVTRAGSVVDKERDLEIVKSTDNLVLVNCKDLCSVIVSKSLSVSDPIVGYTDAYPTEDMPEGFVWWLEAMDKSVLDKNNSQQTRATKTPVGPLLSSTWNQTSPYNAQSPSSYPTGCIATAMAQVLYYHKYPVQGKGNHTYTWNSRQLSINFGNTFYDWDNMLDSYSTGNYTTVQKKAVTELMYHCGVSVNMNYGRTGSSAMDYSVSTALVDYFDYDEEVGYLQRYATSMSDAKWNNIIYDNISKKQPVIYSGASNSFNGHCFVLDGYDEKGLFHVNWGWGGEYDGYFNLSDLKPTKDNDYSDLMSQSMVYDIKPKTNQYIDLNVGINGHEYVDLGLPSGKLWSKYNFDTKKESDYGRYFAWIDISDVPKQWGECWTAPSANDIVELVNNCKGSRTTVNGVSGYKFVGPSGKSIFLPAAGVEYIDGHRKTLGFNGQMLYYWTKDAATQSDAIASMCFETGNFIAKTQYDKKMGLSVRPVATKNSVPTRSVYVKEIKLPKSSFTMKTGSSMTLKVSVLPVNAYNKKVNWTSSNKTVASVSSKGLVSALSAGTTKITAKADDGSGITASCEITVKSSFVYVSKITLSSSSLQLKIGESATIKPTISPSDATKKDVEWKSENSAVASVDNTGKITAKSVGTTNIIVTATDGSKVSATCKVSVNPIEVESINLNYTKSSLKLGETLQLAATIKPDNATNKEIEWKSSNTDVATVSYKGLVKAVGVGDVTITASCGNKVASCKISVNPIEVERIELNHKNYSLKKGETLKLEATIYPKDATNKDVVWSSSNEDIAMVSNTGLVKALGFGEVAITATCGDAYAVCTITVRPILVEKIELNHTTYSLVKNEMLQLVATVLPENATNKEVAWTSSNEEVVMVSSSGKAVFLGFGDAIVTATATDGSGVSATCTFSNVDGILTITPDEKLGLEIYTIDGKRVEKVEKGMNIIQTKDGKVKKVYVK